MSLLAIFDIDGTLLFSNKIDSQLFSETFESRYSNPFPSIDWNYFPHVTDHTIFTSAFQELHEFPPSAQEIIDFQDEFVDRLKIAREKTPDEFQPVPGVVELFEALRNKQRNYTWEREVYIGDALWDVRTCKNLAMPFIGLRREGDHELLLEQGTHHVFSDYQDQAKFFEALHAAQVPK